MKKDIATASAGPGTGRLDDSPEASSDGPGQASPYKSAAEELDVLRKTFRSVCHDYAKRIEGEITRLRERVTALGEQQLSIGSDTRAVGRGGKKDAAVGGTYLHDLRDMTSLLRTLDVKPLVGRRKDLKKIESLVEELRLLVERWV